MLASLTCRLIVAPSGAWRELANRHDDELPSPALHGAMVVGCAVVTAAVGCGLTRMVDFSSGLRITLAAIAAGAGATALAISFVPACLPGVRDRSGVDRLRRYVSVSSLPLAASGVSLPLCARGTWSLWPAGFAPAADSGWFGLSPSVWLAFSAIAACGALAFNSGLLGARTFLGLTGPEPRRVAGLTSLVATLPALFAASLCVVR